MPHESRTPNCTSRTTRILTHATQTTTHESFITSHSSRVTKHEASITHHVSHSSRSVCSSTTLLLSRLSTSRPLERATSQSLDLSTSRPLDLSTARPLNLSNARPLDLSTSQTRDLPTSRTRDLSTLQTWSPLARPSPLTHLLTLAPLDLSYTAEWARTRVHGSHVIASQHLGGFTSTIRARAPYPHTPYTRHSTLSTRFSPNPHALPLLIDPLRTTHLSARYAHSPDACACDSSHSLSRSLLCSCSLREFPNAISPHVPHPPSARSTPA
jgi:hypothetical protein